MKGSIYEKSQNHLFDPVITLIRIYTEIIVCEMIYVYGTYCYIVYSCKRSETIYMSIGSRLLNELWYTPTVKYYVVIKKNKETLYIRIGNSQRNIK